jgi:hypothetical protein
VIRFWHPTSPDTAAEVNTRDQQRPSWITGVNDLEVTDL